MKFLLIISALFLFIIIILIQCPEPEKKEIKINYVIKAKTANRLYIKDKMPAAKISLSSDLTGKIIPFDEIKELYTSANENCVYVSLDGGTFSVNEETYYYESIIEIERGNKSATYGVSGINIIYFKSY